MASMTLGAAAAAREGPMSWGWLTLTVLGIVLLEAAKNASGELLAASVPLGLLIAAFLWINELPDAAADRSAGKRTLVVRLGRSRAGRVFAVLPAAAFLLIALLPAWGLPRAVWLGFAGLPFAAAAARRAWMAPERTASLVPAQAWTLVAFLVASLGMAAGLLLTR